MSDCVVYGVTIPLAEQPGTAQGSELQAAGAQHWVGSNAYGLVGRILQYAWTDAAELTLRLRVSDDTKALLDAQLTPRPAVGTFQWPPRFPDELTVQCISYMPVWNESVPGDDGDWDTTIVLVVQ